ncbi:hypothetical protein [Streptomyces armeniacus]|uniref:hypothetical protein n=1 Tax=Streptomyces armeniacus TaxID=83291 RepID=UPI001AD7E759|nr:hypothetical protein [Streptomyces armeniacus]
MQSTERRLPRPDRFRKRWRRYGRLVATNFLRGAAYASGTATIGLLAWWVQAR